MDNGKEDIDYPGEIIEAVDREEQERRSIQEYIFQLEEAKDTATEQVKAQEEDLQETVSLLQATLESTADGILVIDLAGRIVSYNQKFAKMWRLPDEVLKSHDDARALGWLSQQLKNPQVFLHRVKELYERPHEQSFDILEFIDGRIFERFTQAQYLGDRIVGRVWSFRDITERRRVEEVLKQSEQRLKLALSAANRGWYDVNVQTGEAMVSEEYARMLGYEPEKFSETADKCIARLHPDDREAVATAYHAYLKGELPEYRIEFRQQTKSGDWLWTLSMGSIVEWDADGKPRRMLGTHTDISQRKRVEEALRESERQLAQLIDFLPDAMFAIDRQGKIIIWNRAIEEMTGVKAESILNEDGHAYTIPFYGIRRPALIDLALANDPDIEKKYLFIKREGDILEAEAEVILKGENRLLYAKARPLYDSQGNVIGAVEAIRDITERQQAEEERAKLEARMREVQKLESLGVLAGGIAHDFNNLLMGIMGNADLAQLSLSPASPAIPYLQEITRASQRAADLCNQMLAYSGKGRFLVRRYNLSEIVREMARMLEVSISKKAMLNYRLADALPAVEADATQLRQIIMNLIINASEALNDQNGVITLSTGVMDCDRRYLSESYLDDNLAEGRYVFLKVSDTGAGIDEETRQRIFDPFFTTKFTGRGLGLAAVLGIVRGHRGAIRVASEPDRGTTFTILLPAVLSSREEMTTDAVLCPTPLQERTVLLVDDDPGVRQVGVRMLRYLGFSVLTAADGQQALELVQAQGDDIDCVLLDLTMPRMGGEETFVKLRALRSNIPVILSSGYNEQDVVQHFYRGGLAGFIQKPYSLTKLREILSEALSLRKH